MKVTFSSEDQILFVDTNPPDWKNVFDVPIATIERWQRIERELLEMQDEIRRITNGVDIMPPDGKRTTE